MLKNQENSKELAKDMDESNNMIIVQEAREIVREAQANFEREQTRKRKEQDDLKEKKAKKAKEDQKAQEKADMAKSGYKGIR